MPPGRPRKVAEVASAQEVRLTPSDGLPIDFDDAELKTLCPRFAAFEEGGAETGPKLHYHCLFETAQTQPVVMNVLNRLARKTDEKKGNAIVGAYRFQHEGSIGYAVKCGKCAHRQGYDNLWLEESLAKNAAYWRQKEATKKAKQRAQISFADEVHDMLITEHQGRDWTVEEAVEKVLAYYADKRVQFPPKFTMERIVHRQLWATGRRHQVVVAYSKNLSF